MAKTKFKIKITGLEVEFEGDREDLPRVTENIAGQMGGMMSIPSVVAPARVLPPPTQETVSEPNQKPKRRKSKTISTSGSTQSKSTKKAQPIDWDHDIERWGQPPQSWNPTKKAIWLIYVVKQETSRTEVTASEIAESFNKHFQESGRISASNVSRDLRKVKQQQPALASNNTTASPNPWYLTQAGVLYAEGLVAEARGLEGNAAG